LVRSRSNGDSRRAAAAAVGGAAQKKAKRKKKVTKRQGEDKESKERSRARKQKIEKEKEKDRERQRKRERDKEKEYGYWYAKSISTARGFGDVIIMGEAGGKVFFITARLVLFRCVKSCYRYCGVVLLCYCVIGGWESILALLPSNSGPSFPVSQFSTVPSCPVLSCSLRLVSQQSPGLAVQPARDGAGVTIDMCIFVY
jgi:hypothetical protein